MAPQVLQGRYTSQADMWSLGVIAFMLLSSNMPFYGEGRREVVHKILRCSFKFESRRWMFISDEAKDFVQGLLVYNADKRLTANQALRAPWLKKRIALSKREPEQEFMDHVQGALENFGTYGKLKKVALMIIAHTSSVAEVQHLRKAFNKYDSDNRGTISYAQFKSALHSFFYSDEEIDLMFRALDVDERGIIHYTEFLAATFETHGMIEEGRIAECFDRLDSSCTGYISHADLYGILGPECTDEDVDKCMAEADFDGDNMISYDDFLMLFHDQQQNLDDNVQKIVLRRRHSLTNLDDIGKSPPRSPRVSRSPKTRLSYVSTGGVDHLSMSTAGETCDEWNYVI